MLPRELLDYAAPRTGCAAKDWRICVCHMFARCFSGVALCMERCPKLIVFSIASSCHPLWPFFTKRNVRQTPFVVSYLDWSKLTLARSRTYGPGATTFQFTLIVCETAFFSTSSTVHWLPAAVSTPPQQKLIAALPHRIIHDIKNNMNSIRWTSMT